MLDDPADVPRCPADVLSNVIRLLGHIALLCIPVAAFLFWILCLTVWR